MKVCTSKTCTVSGPQPASAFYRDRQKKDGLSSRCRVCIDMQQHEWATQNPRTYARTRWAALLKYKYGVTVEWYAHALNDCEHACEVCKQPFTEAPHVDHNHVTGAARGLLCRQCNHGLGNFLDNPKLLAAAISYLQRNS